MTPFLRQTTSSGRSTALPQQAIADDRFDVENGTHVVQLSKASVLGKRLGSGVRSLELLNVHLPEGLLR